MEAPAWTGMSYDTLDKGETDHRCPGAYIHGKKAVSELVIYIYIIYWGIIHIGGRFLITLFMCNSLPLNSQDNNGAFGRRFLTEHGSWLMAQPG